MLRPPFGEPESGSPRVLLTDTTRWERSARIAVELSSAGCSVSAVCLARRHPFLETRVVDQVFPYSSLRPLESLAAAIRATDPKIIIPCDDRAVQHLHQLHRQARLTGADNIAGLIERSLGPPRSYPIVSVRFNLLDIARQEGLRVPATQAIHTLDDLSSWGAEHDLPWVLKADRTWGGGGVHIAPTVKHAQRFFKRIPRFFGTALAVKRLVVNRDPFWLLPSRRRWRPGVIVQSHIQGRPANCAVVCWEGRVLAGIAAEVVSSEKPTGPATAVRIVDNPEMMVCAESIARRLGLSGFFGLDFMIEEGTGASHLIEMNPRCTPLCHLRMGQGRDLIGALYAQLSGRAPQGAPSMTQKDRIEIHQSSPPSPLFARAARLLNTYFGLH